MGSKFGQAGALIGVAGFSYDLSFDDFVDLPSGTGHDVEWDFGDGSAAGAGSAASHTWQSPGVYDLTISYFVSTSPLKKRLTFTVKMGFDTRQAYDRYSPGDDPYAPGMPVVLASVGKIRVPGQSTRLGFYLSPALETDQHDMPYGDPLLGDDEIKLFFNMCKEIEHLHANVIMRHPVPKVDELENGLYTLFDQDVLFLGTSDWVREGLRLFSEVFADECTAELDDHHPYRLFQTLINVSSRQGQFPKIAHPYRPLELILPEGKGLRLAREELLADLLDNEVSALTVREKQALEAKRDKEKNYSLLWLRNVLWPLSSIIYRYLRAIRMVEVGDYEGKRVRSQPLVVFNPDDLSLSVRLISTITDLDAYGADLVSWRHVSTQVNFVPENDAEEVFAKYPLGPKRMYEDRTGDAVRVLPHDEAEALVGEAVQADEKIVSVNGAYYLFSGSNRMLTPVGGGGATFGASGGPYAMMTTRGGGATLSSFSVENNPALGNIATVESWLSTKKESTARWKGLAKTPTESELLPEGVDTDLEVSAWHGVDGETIKVLGVSDFDENDPYQEFPEYVCNIALGPRDLGQFDVGSGDGK